MSETGFDTLVKSRVEGLPVRITRRLGTTKTRVVTTLAGFGSGIKWRVHNNSLQNLVRGLVERVYKVQGPTGLVPTPQPLAGAFSRLNGFTAAIRKHLPRSAPVDYDTFVGYYKGRKRTVYAKAAESLVSTPVKRSDARVSAFVKAEKINTSKKPDPAPRLIQPRDPRYNVAVGVFLRPLEKLVYRAIAKAWGGPTVLKGMNAAEQGSALYSMWCQFDNPVAVGLDASRFDQHVSRAALEWEHSVYALCFRGDDLASLRKLLSWQLHNRGRAYTAEGKIEYEVEGCRMSGDINTSLGNCLIMSAMVWAWCQYVGVPARLANNGDDCVVIMESRFLPVFSRGLQEWFLELGFEMQVEAPVHTFEQVQFCQTQPVCVDGAWIMVRDPRVAISKDLVTLLGMPHSYQAYVGAIGECGLSAYGGVPVFQEFYASLQSAGKPSKLLGESSMAMGLRHLSKGMGRQYQPVKATTRASFALAFGITPDEQEQLELWLLQHPVPAQAKQSVTNPAPVWYI